MHAPQKRLHEPIHIFLSKNFAQELYARISCKNVRAGFSRGIMPARRGKASWGSPPVFSAETDAYFIVLRDAHHAGRTTLPSYACDL